MTLDETVRTEAEEARLRMLDAQHALEVSRSDFHHAIRKLHAAGASMRDIAAAFGLSHQRVHQIVGGEEPLRPPFPPPFHLERRAHRGQHGRRGPRGLLHRFTEPARQVLVAGQEEARTLGHDRLGPEHILLGLAATDDALVRTLLTGAGLDLEHARAAVERTAGRGEGARGGGARNVPFSRDAKFVLELALREALALGDNFIGVEHVLIALARDEEGAAAAILAEHGLRVDDVRAAVERGRAA
jgi:hypothetical protein